MKIKAKQIDFANHAFVNPITVTTTYAHTQTSPHDLLVYTGANPATITFPDPDTISEGIIVSVKRTTAANLTLEPYTNNGTIEGGATYTLNNDSAACFILIDKTNDTWIGMSIFH